jgi:hypothetical protein
MTLCSCFVLALFPEMVEFFLSQLPDAVMERETEPAIFASMAKGFDDITAALEAALALASTCRL